MKILTLFSLLFSILMAPRSFALEYRAACSGNRGKVSVQIYSSGERLYMQYSNAMGAMDFPLYEGVVTRMALPVIKIAEEELAELDEQVLVSWELNKCRFNAKAPLIMECGGEGTFHFPLNSDFKSYTLITSKVTEESLTSKYETFKIRWGIDTPGFHHSLAMPFDPAGCRATLKE